MENKRSLGTFYETVACEFLLSEGFKVLDRNFRLRNGEIDIIGIDTDAYLCFVEVKYRKTKALGTALEAVTFNKAKQVRKMAEFYLYSKRLQDFDVRFDIIAIDGNKLEWIKNAF